MRKVPFYLPILAAFFAAIVISQFEPGLGVLLKPVSEWVIWTIKTAAIPLVFMVILDTLLESEFDFSGARKFVFVILINSCIAVSIALLISNGLQAGRTLPNVSSGSPLAQAKTWSEVLLMFATSPMILAIVIAFASGWFLKTTGRKALVLPRLKTGLKYYLRGIEVLLVFIPVVIFVTTLQLAAKHSLLQVANGLGWYLVVCMGGMGIHVALVYGYWIAIHGGVAPKRFWSFAQKPIVNAFAVNSSLATLPMTLKALEGLGVRPASARLAACVGSNFNNDGILLYEVVAVLFLAQSYGLDLTLTQQGFAIVVAMIACVGVGGVPEAGVISLMMVLSALHLPIEGITVLLTVDWIVARSRSVVNVCGDMACAIAIDRRT